MNTPETRLMKSPTWCQANVAFPDWERAETAAVARLAPLLRAAEDEGTLTAWFIIRKRPCWRVRYLPTPGAHDHIGRGRDALIAEGTITAWTEIIYEPEAHAFGGTEAMASAHRLFHRDSRSVIDSLRNNAGIHRRETSLMLCSLMLRSASWTGTSRATSGRESAPTERGLRVPNGATAGACSPPYVGWSP